LQRPLTLRCVTETCGFTKIKGISAVKFRLHDELLKTKKAGTLSDECRGSVSVRFASTYPGTTLAGPTCDYLQRHDGVINMAVAAGGVPLAMTLGYLGGTSAAVREAVSITKQNETAEILFNSSQDEFAAYVEPLTGMVIKGADRMQSNWYIEKTVLDSKRYANIFSSDTDNGDVFVWPFMYTQAEFSIDDTGAKAFVASVYVFLSNSRVHCLNLAFDSFFWFTYATCILHGWWPKGRAEPKGHAVVSKDTSV